MREKKSPSLVCHPVDTRSSVVLIQAKSMRRERIEFEGMVSDPYYKNVFQEKIYLCVFLCVRKRTSQS